MIWDHAIVVEVAEKIILEKQADFHRRAGDKLISFAKMVLADSDMSFDWVQKIALAYAKELDDTWHEGFNEGMKCMSQATRVMLDTAKPGKVQ